MELIRISDSKLKIILSEEDMRRYELTPETLSYENADTRRAVKELLSEAKHRGGFDAPSDSTLIEVYPSRGGGCELYVTKIMPGGEGEKKKPCPPRKEENGRLAVYLLPTLAALLAVCRQLFATGYCGYSAAYTGEGECCYLVLKEEQRRVGYPPSCPLYHPVEEYGERYGAAGKLPYIREHGCCLLEGDAVQRLADLA